MQRRLFAAAAATLVAAAVLCGAAAAIEYEDVMGPLLHMEAQPQVATEFRFDLTPWMRLVEGNKPPKLVPPNPELQGFLRKMHTLRHLKGAEATAATKARQKRKRKEKKKAKALGALQPGDAPPKMVVVGAGPNGLVAALVGRHYGYEVEVLEMTDGRDTRWNMVMVGGDELRNFLRDVVGISSHAYYSVAEMQYVLAAAAQLAGVGIRYGHQYVRHCPGSRTVLYRPTPAAGNPARRQQPGAAVCTAPGALQSIGGVNMLVGSDGVRSFVRAAMEGNELRLVRPAGVVRDERWSSTLKPVTKFSSVFERFHNGHGHGPDRTDRSTSREYDLVPAAAGNPPAHPLLAMLIFQFRAPPAGVTAVTGPVGPRFLSKVMTQPAGRTQAHFDAMFAANGALDRDQAMAKLIYQNRARRVVRQGAAGHQFEQYTYVDVVFRHRAGKSMWAAFHTLSDAAKLAEVAKHARGEANTLTAGERALADRLLRVMHESGGGYGVTRAEFVQQIESIKMFGQQLRHATHVHQQEKNFEVLLVGDSSRDSYFPHGQSFSTAANAFVRFMQTKAQHREKSKSLIAAAQFHKEEIDDFVDVTASSIYFEGFCGLASLGTRDFSALNWNSALAEAPANDPFTVHLAAPPATVAAAANHQYPADKIKFGDEENAINRGRAVYWDLDQRSGPFAGRWDTFVQHVLAPRCETW